MLDFHTGVKIQVSSFRKTCAQVTQLELLVDAIYRQQNILPRYLSKCSKWQSIEDICRKSYNKFSIGIKTKIIFLGSSRVQVGLQIKNMTRNTRLHFKNSYDKIIIVLSAIQMFTMVTQPAAGVGRAGCVRPPRRPRHAITLQRKAGGKHVSRAPSL